MFIKEINEATMNKQDLIKTVSAVVYIISSWWIIRPPGGLQWIAYICVVTEMIGLYFFAIHGRTPNKKKVLIVLGLAILIQCVLIFAINKISPV